MRVESEGNDGTHRPEAACGHSFLSDLAKAGPRGSREHSHSSTPCARLCAASEARPGAQKTRGLAGEVLSSFYHLIDGTRFPTKARSGLTHSPARRRCEEARVSERKRLPRKREFHFPPGVAAIPPRASALRACSLIAHNAAVRSRQPARSRPRRRPARSLVADVRTWVRVAAPPIGARGQSDARQQLHLAFVHSISLIEDDNLFSLR